MCLLFYKNVAVMKINTESFGWLFSLSTVVDIIMQHWDSTWSLTTNNQCTALSDVNRQRVYIEHVVTGADRAAGVH